MSQDAPHYGPMTEQRAREILRDTLSHDGKLPRKYHDADSDGVDLEGRYSADELEAIAWWMRNKR